MVTVLAPRTSVYVIVPVPTGTTSLIVPFTRTSYSIPDAAASSLDAVQRSQSSSGHDEVPPSRALRSVGVVGATLSVLACVVALTVLLVFETLPDGSTARTCVRQLDPA